MAYSSERTRFKERYKEYYKTFTPERDTGNKYYSKLQISGNESSAQHLSFGVLNVNTRVFRECANVLTGQLSGLVAFKRKIESEPDSYPYSLVGSPPFHPGGVREVALIFQIITQDISKLHYQVSLVVRDELLDVRINNVPLPVGHHKLAPFDVVSFHDSRRERSGHTLVPAVTFNPGVREEDIGKLFANNYYYRRYDEVHSSESSKFFKGENVRLDTPEAIRLGFDTVRVHNKDIRIRER
jgi:hypothetical protein